MDKRGAEYEKLNNFVGHWKTEGKIAATNAKAETKVAGTDTYQWLPGGFFLLHKVDVHIGDDHNQTLEVIGYDRQNHSYILRHFDNKGNSGLMVGSCVGDDWTFQGENLRFSGGFKKDYKEFSGTWEQSSDKKSWASFMELRLTKVLSKAE